ncbi:MAG: hypothetical protein ACREVZ_10715, partial [Burkholderiales bacterium]
MMRRLQLFLGVFFLCALTARGQLTAVSGTVTDPNGIPYANGTVKAQLVLAGAGVTGQPTVTNNNAQQCASAGKGSAPCQIEFPGTVGPFAMDQNGSFTVALQDNALVTPAATQWLFTVSITPGVFLPLGFGPQSFSVPVTISGASQTISTLLNPSAPRLSRVSGSSVAFSNVVDPTGFGVKADGLACYGSNATITVTNLSNQVSCNLATFTIADIGKYIFATNGAGGVGAQIGSIVGIKGTITAVISSTTVQVSANATASISGANAFLGWGTLDDNGWDLAEAAWASELRCNGIVVPRGYSFIARAHLNTIGTGCSGQTTTVSYDSEVFGWGPGASILVPTPDFDFGTCTFGVALACFFAYPQATVRDMGIFGGANSLTGTTHANVLVNPGLGSQLYNVSFSGFGASSTSLIGFRYNNGVRTWGMSSDGFGRVGCDVQSGGANAYAMWHFCGDNAGPNLQVGGANTFFDYGGQYGGTTSTTSVTWNTTNAKYTCIGCS